MNHRKQQSIKAQYAVAVAAAIAGSHDYHPPAVSMWGAPRDPYKPLTRYRGGSWRKLTPAERIIENQRRRNQGDPS